MTHTADDMHDDMPMTEAVSAEAVDLIADAITEQYGERCPDYEPECWCCKVWKQYDALTSLAAEVEALKRERDELIASTGEHITVRSEQREHIRKQAEDIMTLGKLVYDDSDPPVEWKACADALAAELAQCREALKPFAEAVERDDKRATQDGYRPSFDEYEKAWFFRYGVLRRARTALKGTSHERA